MIRWLAIGAVCTAGIATYVTVWRTLTSHSELAAGDFVVVTAAVAIGTALVVWRSR